MLPIEPETLQLIRLSEYPLGPQITNEYRMAKIHGTSSGGHHYHKPTSYNAPFSNINEEQQCSIKSESKRKG